MVGTPKWGKFYLPGTTFDGMFPESIEQHSKTTHARRGVLYHLYVYLWLVNKKRAVPVFISYGIAHIAGNLSACSIFGGSWLSVIGLLLNRSDHFVTYMKKTIPDPSTFFRVPVEGTYSFFLCIMY